MILGARNSCGNEEMNGDLKEQEMPQGFVIDYEGPYCFYKYLRDRQKRSPFYLDRNIRRVQGGFRKSTQGSRQTVQVNLSEPVDGTIVYVHILRKDQHTFIVQSGVKTTTLNDGVAHLQVAGWLQKFKKSGHSSTCVMLLVVPSSEGTSVREDHGDDDGGGYYDAIEIGMVISSKRLVALMAPTALCDHELSSCTVVEFITWRTASAGNLDTTAVAQRQHHKSTPSPRKLKHAQTESMAVTYALIGARQDIELSLVPISNATSTRDDAMQRLRHQPLKLARVCWVGQTTNTSTPALKDSEHGQSKGSKLYMHYLFKDREETEMSSFVEMHEALECNWCGCQRDDASRFLQHLRCCHYHFKYEVTFDQQRNLHVVVRRDVGGNSSERDLHEDRFAAFEFASNRYGAHATPSPELEVEHIPCVVVSQRQDSARYYAPGELRVVPARQTYHVRTGTATIPTEYDYVSDDDVDKTWELSLSEKLIDEFEDVSSEEKEFMKLWNRHLKSKVVLADAHLADSCELFARRFAPNLFEQKLRHQFLLHLITLWDFSLLCGDDVSRCMAVLDAATPKCKKT